VIIRIRSSFKPTDGRLLTLQNVKYIMKKKKIGEKKLGTNKNSLLWQLPT